MPWSEVVLAALADGKWHPASEVISDAAGAVPPGRAFRTGTAHKDPDTSNWTTMQHAAAVSRGQRATVRGAIASMVKSGRLQQRGEAGDLRELRLAP